MDTQPCSSVQTVGAAAFPVLSWEEGSPAQEAEEQHWLELRERGGEGLGGGQTEQGFVGHLNVFKFVSRNSRKQQKSAKLGKR